MFVSAAQAQISGGDFGEHIVGGQAWTALVTVRNVGAQALTISGATLAGANASEFQVSADACVGTSLAFHHQCTISVSFAPTAGGPATTSLRLSDNESEPAVATLSGIGVATGGTGTTGDTGGGTGDDAGTTGGGAGGPVAALSTASPRARTARVELLTCRTSTAKGKKRTRCSTKLLKAGLTVTASTNNAKASLRRAGKLYATGTLRRTHGSLRLVLDATRRKRLPSGAYTLMLRWKVGKSTHTSRERIALG